jgi:hypothetical protein
VKIIEVERLSQHPHAQTIYKGIGHTLRIYFDSGLRITVYKDDISFTDHDKLSMTWNNSAQELHADILALVNPVIEENRNWLMED